MSKSLIIIFIVFISLFGKAQVSDDFSDGNITQNPSWNGDVQYFQVVNEVLQSNGPSTNGSSVADTLYLSVPINKTMNSFEWKLLIDLKFNPTSSNYVRFYLSADQSDLKKDPLGYYIEIGRSTADSIKLFKRTNIGKELLFVGNSSFGGNVKVRLWVRRDSAGYWNVMSDVNGGANFTSEGLLFRDTTYSHISYSGIYCSYKTDSRHDQFHFDDYLAGQILQDLSPPKLNYFEVISSTQIGLHFSEPLDSSTAQNVSSFTIDKGIGNPVLSALDPITHSEIQLLFSNSLLIDENYLLSISTIRDIAGNIMPDTSVAIVYHQAQAYDIVINEIMTDVNPKPNYLPEKDFVELLNRSPSATDLQHWSIILNGNNRKVFDQSYILDPGAYLILCHEDDEAAFSNYGDTYGFSSFSINNEGSVSLKNDLEQVIHHVNFDKDWYDDEIKADGGWSLEMIDPNNPCSGIDNWRSSVDSKGGTPSEQNSIYAVNADITIPGIDRIEVVNPNQIMVVFSETIDSLQLSDAQNYQIDKGIGFPILAKAIAPDYRRVLLTLGSSLLPDSIYNMVLVTDVNDCSGNLSDCCVELKFGLPQIADTNDLIINEVLFNPLSSGVDYVEIYNRSNKIIDISSYYLATIDAVLGSIEQVSSILDYSHQMFPGDYLLLTTDINKVRAQYITKDLDAFIEMKEFPSLSNSSGSVLVVDQTLKVIDRLNYNDDMHFDLLTSFDGVSLERIGFDRRTNDETNWHSAAESAGFGTPGYINSQSLLPIGVEGVITVNPEVFSPDNDGFDDVISFQYHFEENGNVMSIRIFDSRGRMIRFLMNNEQIAPSGSISWDGLDDHNQKARTGMYIAVFDIFNLEGKKSEYKKTFILASQLGN